MAACRAWCIFEPASVDREPELQRAIEQIRLGEAKHQIALQVADVGLHRQSFAPAQEIVGAVAEPDKGTRQTAHAAGQADAVFSFFLHLQKQVDGARFLVEMAFGDAGIVRLQHIEEAQLIQTLQADLPELRTVDLAFLQHNFAADDFVAGGGVALELDAADGKLLALVHVNVDE